MLYIFSLTSNHLASAGTSVYKIIVQTEGILEFWKVDLMPVLLHCLCHDKRPLVRCNARNHWLNPTLAHLPKDAAEIMIQNMCHCDQCSMANFLILKGLRTNGQLQDLSQVHRKSLELGLCHSNPEVRIAAFAVICHVKKKGTLPCSRELELTKHFIQDNLCVDEPSFRQVRTFMNSVKYVPV